MTCGGIKELRSEAGSVESSPLSRDESLCATERRDDAGLWLETNCARAMESTERWAYGEQLKRKPEKW